MARTADTAWLDGSIAALRGVGWRGKSRLHELTEAAQGKYHYTIGPYSDAGSERKARRSHPYRDARCLRGRDPQRK